MAEKTAMTAIKARPLGKTGAAPSRVGLGGEGVLRTFGKSAAAKAVIDEAVRQGITYFDSARAYAGSEGYYGAYWPFHREERARVFQTSKSASRDREGAIRDLETTLRTMGAEYLDLWQIHDVRTMDDVSEIEREGGALEVFIQAKEEGHVKHIGVTGHHDPDVLTYAIEHWPVDTVLLPVNPVEGAIGGFLDRTLPAARRKGIGVIGMKIMGAGSFLYPELGITPEQLIRYALSWPISVAIVGCKTPEEVKTLAETGRTFTPMSDDEQQRLVAAFKPFARQLAYYRGDLNNK
ncbi:MAG: 2,5-diketo-D-gluconate reductase A [Methanocella sp. PtaU1.Bin125]|nr:MAG: 2,5-diketo-D-gluconate reductase A [Methanocella sp. PtaU1.Bin125]